MSSIVATTPRNVMDKKVVTFSPKQQQQNNNNNNNNQEPLRCPRCESSNTKFCYYNNYSLSQPRHFCKACKRYWTRGGTLRSVPVGGGSRKNKRVKRSPSHSSSSTTTTTTTNNNNNTNNTSNNNTNLNETCGNNGHNNPFHFPFSSFDLENPPQINCLGLGFSSGLIENGGFRNGFNVNLQNKQIFQDLISSNTYPSNSTSTPSISSLFASNIGAILPSYEDSLQMEGNEELGMVRKDMKMEVEGQSRSFDHQWSAPSQNQMENNIVSPSSSNQSLIWGSSGHNLGAWLDYPSNNNHLPSFI